MLNLCTLQQSPLQHKGLQPTEFIADILWPAEFRFVVQCKKLIKKIDNWANVTSNLAYTSEFFPQIYVQF